MFRFLLYPPPLDLLLICILLLLENIVLKNPEDSFRTFLHSITKCLRIHYTSKVYTQRKFAYIDRKQNLITYFNNR